MSLLSLFGGRNKRTKKLRQDRRRRQKRRILFEPLQSREMMAADLGLFANVGLGGPNQFNLVELSPAAVSSDQPGTEQALGYVGFSQGMDSHPQTGLIYSGRASLYELDPVTKSLREIGKIHSATESSLSMRSFTFSSDGALFGTDGEMLYTIDTGTAFAEAVGTINEQSIFDTVYGIEFAADGTLYAAGFELMTLNPQTAEITGRVGRLKDYVVELDSAPDGSLLAVLGPSSKTGQIVTINPATATQTLVATYASDLNGIASRVDSQEPNVAPVAAPDSFTVAVDSVLAGNLLENDSDDDGNRLSASLTSDASHGTIDLHSDGSFSYTPEAGFFGADSFTYVASDGRETSQQVTVSLTVNPPKGLPGGNDYFANAGSNSPHSFNLVGLSATTGDNADAEQPLGYVGFSQGMDVDPRTGLLYSGRSQLYELDPTTGQVTVVGPIQTEPGAALAIRSFSFSPTGILHGTDGKSIYTINPQTATAEWIAEFQIESIFDTVYGIEFAADGTLYAAGFQLMTVDPNSGAITGRIGRFQDYVVELDFTEQGKLLGLVGTSSRQGHVVEIDLDTADQRTVAAYPSDLQGIASRESGQQVSPVGIADACVVTEDGSLSMDDVDSVLANDLNLVSATVSMVGDGPQHASSFTLHENGTFHYEPERDFTGKDQFVYQATDARGSTESVTVTIEVEPVNDAPTVATPLSDVQANEDADTVLVNLAGAFADTDDRSLELTVAGNTNEGLLDAEIIGRSLSLDFAAEQHGASTITVRATDEAGTFVEQSFEVRVASVNDAPVAKAISQIRADEDSDVEPIDLTGVFSDTEGDALAFHVVSNTNENLVATSITDGMLGLELRGDQHGSAAITIRAADSAGAFVDQLLNLTVTSVNDAPQTSFDLVRTNEDTAVTIDVLANDYDAEDGKLTLVEVGSPTHGTVQLLTDGWLEYTPAEDKFDLVHFYYTVEDEYGAQTTETVYVLVSPVNDAPKLTVIDTIQVAEGVSFTPDQPVIIATDADPEDTVTLSHSELPGGVTFIDLGNGKANFEFNPDYTAAGQHTITVTATDLGGATATQQVFVQIENVNQNPTITPAAIQTHEDQSVVFNALANASDADGDTLTLTSFTQGSHGSVELRIGGELRYTPEAEFSGTDTFTYTVSDGLGGEAIGTATVTVTYVNDRPVIQPIADETVAFEPAVFHLAGLSQERTLSIPVQVTDKEGHRIAISAMAVANAEGMHLQQGYELQSEDESRFNSLGLNEKWLISKSGQAYLMLPSGAILRWTDNGDGTAAPGEVIAKFDATAYEDPSLLLDVQPEPIEGVRTATSAEEITITLPAGVAGSVEVLVTADDGNSRSTELFTIHVEAAESHGLGETFDRLTSGYKTALTGSDGSVYALKENGTAWKYQHGGWTKLGVSGITAILLNDRGEVVAEKRSFGTFTTRIYQLETSSLSNTEFVHPVVNQLKGRDNVGIAGNRLFVLRSGGRIDQYDGISQSWKDVSAGKTFITLVGSGNDAYALSNTDVLYRRAGNAWQQVATNQMILAANATGDVYSLSEGENLYRWSASSPTAVGTGHINLVKNSNGDIYTLGNDHILYRWLGGRWESIGTGHLQLVTNTQGDAYTLGDDHVLYHWVGTRWSAVGTGHVTLVSSAGGDVYTLGGDELLYRWVGKTWKAVGSGHLTLVSNASGDVYTLGHDDILYGWNGNSWKAIGSGHVQLVSNAAGDAYTLGRDRVLYRWVGGKWQSIGSGHLAVAVDGSNQAYTLGGDGVVYHWSGTRWTSLGGDTSTPVVGNRGDAYVLGEDQVLYRWEGTTYRAIGTGHRTLLTNSRGDVYTLGNDQVLYRWVGHRWTAVGRGHSTLVRNAQGDVYTLGNDRVLYRWVGKSWKAIGSGHTTLISNANGDAYTLGSNLLLYRWLGTSWKAIGSGHAALVANANGDAYTLGNDQVLYRWEGNSWRAIGSGHAKLVANANGDVYTLGNDHVLYRWVRTRWAAIGSGHIDLSVSRSGDAHTLGGDNAVYRWIGTRWTIVQRFGLTLAQQFAQNKETLRSDIAHDLRRQIEGLPGNVKGVSVTSLHLSGDKIKGNATLTLGHYWGKYFGRSVRVSRDFNVSFTHATSSGHTEMTGLDQTVDLAVKVLGKRFSIGKFNLNLDLGPLNQLFDIYDHAIRPTLKHLSGGGNYVPQIASPIPSLNVSTPTLPSRVRVPTIGIPNPLPSIPPVEIPGIVKDPGEWFHQNVVKPAQQFSDDLDRESRRLGGDIAHGTKETLGDAAEFIKENPAILLGPIAPVIDLGKAAADGKITPQEAADLAISFATGGTVDQQLAFAKLILPSEAKQAVQRFESFLQQSLLAPEKVIGGLGSQLSVLERADFANLSAPAGSGVSLPESNPFRDIGHIDLGVLLDEEALLKLGADSLLKRFKIEPVGDTGEWRASFTLPQYSQYPFTFSWKTASPTDWTLKKWTANVSYDIGLLNVSYSDGRDYGKAPDPPSMFSMTLGIAGFATLKASVDAMDIKGGELESIKTELSIQPIDGVTLTATGVLNEQLHYTPQAVSLDVAHREQMGRIGDWSAAGNLTAHYDLEAVAKAKAEGENLNWTDDRAWYFTIGASAGVGGHRLGGEGNPQTGETTVSGTVDAGDFVPDATEPTPAYQDETRGESGDGESSGKQTIACSADAADPKCGNDLPKKTDRDEIQPDWMAELQEIHDTYVPAIGFVVRETTEADIERDYLEAEKELRERYNEELSELGQQFSGDIENRKDEYAKDMADWTLKTGKKAIDVLKSGKLTPKDIADILVLVNKYGKINSDAFLDIKGKHEVLKSLLEEMKNNSDRLQEINEELRQYEIDDKDLEGVPSV